jgi:hypothetical protein
VRVIEQHFRDRMWLAAREQQQASEGQSLQSTELANFLTTCAHSIPLDDNDVDDIRRNYGISPEVAQAAINGLRKVAESRVDYRQMKGCGEC